MQRRINNSLLRSSHLFLVDWTHTSLKINSKKQADACTTNSIAQGFLGSNPLKEILFLD